MEKMEMKCRFCDSNISNTVINLGKSPLANSYLKEEEISSAELFYPLEVFVCSNCMLVQSDVFESPKKIFSDYAYFSSYSTLWLEHVTEYVENVCKRFDIKKTNQVIEIASNDGYLLQNFKKYEIPILGIEPAMNIAKIAENKGIPTVVKFFSSETAQELVDSGTNADLLIAFNVLPHVPNLNDFVKGLKILLKKNGIITIQFSSYLLQVLKKILFDTIYHEHFSYFSLYTLQKIFSSHGLKIFDVEELPIHGGSLRMYITHEENHNININENVSLQIKKELEYGITKIETYGKFKNKVIDVKINIWELLSTLKKQHKTIVAYGAPAKGNTLLNYCGIGTDLIEYTVDINPHKQNKYLPGTNIPIYKPEKIFETKPDYVIILAWNLKNEIMKQMSQIQEWNGKFIELIPETRIIEY